METVNSFWISNKYIYKIMGDIFISIACYRDSQVIPTVENAYKNAKHKNHLFFGVYAQLADNDVEL